MKTYLVILTNGERIRMSNCVAVSHATSVTFIREESVIKKHIIAEFYAPNLIGYYEI